MPSTMIHLAVARALEPDADARCWVGNFAPDCVDRRAEKDTIHLRDRADRWAALAELRGALDKGDAFARGWLTHLFADACWDEVQLGAFRAWQGREHPGEDWFLPYRAEIARATFWLYHKMPWGKGVMDAVASADLTFLPARLPVPPALVSQYRDRVVARHRAGDPNDAPRFFRGDEIDAFARETADRYRSWIT